MLYALLSIVWFLAYWILGGVFFALVALLRLGRVRKVRFSCLFTLLSAASACAAAFYGLRASAGAVTGCLSPEGGRLEAAAALFGCGFATMLGAFLLGTAAVIVLGFLLMACSRPAKAAWIEMGENKKLDE